MAQGDVKTLSDVLQQHEELLWAEHEEGSMLHIASRLCKPRVVELLLSRGADPNGVDEDGQTPLFSAASM